LIHLAHLINPVARPAADELRYAQPITFESIRLARENAVGKTRLELLTAQFPEDHPIIPDYFKPTQDLNRSVLDQRPFTHPKKFPLLADLLDRLYHGSEAEYLIYTNVDIALKPDFYIEVCRKIEAGYDAFMINRRRIPAIFQKPEQLPEMFALKGAAHPGFDCFVFHRSLYPKFQLAKVCIGIPYMEITFSQNLFCYAARCGLFDKEHLTFHLGMEIFKRRDPQYLRYNRNEFRKALKKMWPEMDNRKFPWGQKNLIYRMTRWALHPAIPIWPALRLEPRRWRS
jgi:hypothetical protein